MDQLWGGGYVLDFFMVMFSFLWFFGCFFFLIDFFLDFEGFCWICFVDLFLRVKYVQYFYYVCYKLCIIVFFEIKIYIFI